jgi:hypothetical protein
MILKKIVCLLCEYPSNFQIAETNVCSLLAQILDYIENPRGAMIPKSACETARKIRVIVYINIVNVEN